jgi:hypothetical protein
MTNQNNTISDDIEVTPSGRIKLTREQFTRLQEAAAREKELRVKLNGLQGILQSALGNISKVTKDIQELLRDAVEAEVIENKTRT